MQRSHKIWNLVGANNKLENLGGKFLKAFWSKKWILFSLLATNKIINN